MHFYCTYALMMNFNNNDLKTAKILIVDDHDDIHEDFKLIFSSVYHLKNELDELLEDILDEPERQSLSENYKFEIDSAHQGKEALQLVENAIQNGTPYSVIFMDVRMPPGWNGVETIRQIWKNYPETNIVLSTAYSDFSWEEIIQTLGYSHHLLILKKPYDRLEVIQQTLSLIIKSEEINDYKKRIAELEQELEKHRL